MLLSRRTLLALGAGVVVTACGSGSSGTTNESSGASSGTSAAEAVSTGPAADASGFVVVQRFPNTALTPGRVRLPVSLADSGGTLTQTGPDSISGRILDADQAEVATFSAARHGLDMVIPYWPVTAELAEPGVYYLAVDGASGDPAAFQLFDPAEVDAPTIGSQLAGFDTPTTDDARGVDPICTRLDGACPFHEVTLTDALATGKPVVYIIGTPAHCSTGTCAPGLDYLVEQAPRFEGRATFVHAEVYTDDTATTVAPAVTASGLSYEPVIFVTDGSGTIADRIDVIWDGEELATLLDAAIA